MARRSQVEPRRQARPPTTVTVRASHVIEAPPPGLLGREPLAASALQHLQRLAGNSAVGELLARRPAPEVQRFGSEEHRQIGAAGSGDATVTIDIGDPANPLTHGELVALSGDYFRSPDEIMQLSQSAEGKAQIRWARYDSMHRGNPGTISDETKKHVKDRYYQLAAINMSHFSAGGTARSEYERLHRSAMQEAFMAAATGDAQMSTTADVTEAFSEHHLTDMFSAGHVRTPRTDIKTWYDQHLPGSVERFVQYTAHWVTTKLDSYGDIPFWCPNSKVQSGIRDKVRELGGSAVDTFSLGDIVSLALHDRENAEGLWVVSDLDPQGNTVDGGFHWPEKAKGDDHLAESPLTRQMAETAVRTSLQDIREARGAGEAATHGTCLPQEALEEALNRFMATANANQALGYVPRSDEDRNQHYIEGPDAAARPDDIDYRWGRLDDTTYRVVDGDVKGFIANKLSSMSGQVGDQDGMVHEANIAEWLPGLGPEMVGHNFPLIDLHVRRAFNEYCDFLRAQGIGAIESAMGTPARGGSGGGGGDMDAGLP